MTVEEVTTQETIDALNKSNFILYALQGRIEEDYREELLNVIKTNKNIADRLKGIEHQERIKTITPGEIQNDLEVLNLMDHIETSLQENKGFITQLVRYKVQDRHKYYRVLEAVQTQKATGKETIKGIQPYIIGALKKEFRTNENNSNN